MPLLLLSAFERKHTQLEIDDDVLKRNFNTASVLLCNFITNEFPRCLFWIHCLNLFLNVKMEGFYHFISVRVIY